MCGIAGVFGRTASDLAAINAIITTLAHRGPDDQGIWIDPAAGIALGHSRLSIVDLSAAGHQPMRSANGRFILTFNGEIYNFKQIRRELEQQGSTPAGGWQSHCDAEILLEAISRWGLETALAKLSGMFAFALWDRHDRRLTLVRDRFGEKPLYYGWLGDLFVFGSELKALRMHPRFENPLSRTAVALFLKRNYVPAPESIFERIYKLLPGCWLELSIGGATQPSDGAPEVGTCSGGVRLERYWSYSDVVERGLADPISDERDALEELEQALSSSVGRQSVADVPIGAFLSGGIDSSLIVALQQKHSSTPLRTYSIGFDERAYDEAHQASETAAYLGTDHHEQYVTALQAQDLIDTLPWMFDEPFADPSQIPTHILSRLAGKDVKVALTGDGGDELFAGYYHHFLAPRVWRYLQAVPPPARGMITAALSRLPPVVWEQAAGLLANRKQGHIGYKVQKALRAATQTSELAGVCRSLAEEWDADAFPLLGTVPQEQPQSLRLGVAASETELLTFSDTVSYLPDDILCKVDRASMAVGLETRVPFLDHHVAEIAARIPLSMKIRQGRGKFVLRRLLSRHLPPRLVNRPKNGFAAPVGEWLKGQLRTWAEEVLDEQRMDDDGWLDSDLVRSRWRLHLSGQQDATGALWGVLMFNSWLRQPVRSKSIGSRAYGAQMPVASVGGIGSPYFAVTEQCVA